MNNWRVLVVEDERDGQEVVQGILGYFNIAVDVASSADEALRLLGANNYTAAVIDIGLPGMNGLELMQHLREQPAFKTLPCVAITAYHTSQLKKDALGAGFDAYFPKPLDDTNFVRELERVVSAAS